MKGNCLVLLWSQRAQRGSWKRPTSFHCSQVLDPDTDERIHQVQDMHRVYRWNLPSFWWTVPSPSRCHRTYSILCELRWYSACLAPCGTGKREASRLLLIGLQQSGSPFSVLMHPCHLECLWLLGVLWTPDGLSWPASCTRCARCARFQPKC